MSMSRKVAITLFSAALACASSRPAERTERTEGGAQYGAAPAPAREGSAASAGMCPTDLPGTELSAADTADGEALTFTTSGDVSELRRRVRAMADMHNQRQETRARGQGTGLGAPAEGYGTAEGTAERGGEPPTSNATVEDVEGGARILFTPSGQGDVQQLRSHVRARAADMQRQGCGMMQPSSPMQPSAPTMPSSPGY